MSASDYAQDVVDRAIERESEGSGITESPRPEVQIAAGETFTLCRSLAGHLAIARAPLYRRGPLLVRATRVASTEVQDQIRRPQDSLILQRVTPAMLMGDVSDHVSLMKFDGRKNAHVPTDLPERTARAFIDLSPELKALPAVAGITEAPILLPCGELVTTPGYDPDTGLLFDAGNTDWSQFRIPKQPSQDEAEAALNALREPFRDFPFVGAVDEAVLISTVLSALLRPQLPAAPLHGINGTAPGTGKTLAANVVGMIVTGRPVPAMAMGGKNEEFEKRIDAALLAGDPVALIDNVSRPIHGDTACINLTSSQVRVRIMGTSDQVELPVRTFWMATGNNLTFRGDMTRRAIVCTLDAGVERPDLRKFERDLRTWVPANRLRLLEAAFTVLRAYIQAGSPEPRGLAPLGGFEAWTRRVRDALVWVGMPDLLKSVEDIRNDDPELQQRIAIFEAWRAVYGNAWCSVRDINHQVRRCAENPAGSTTQEQVFADELAGISDGIRFDAKALGLWLRSNRGGIAGGLRLDDQPDRKKKTKRWRVVPIGEAGGV